MRISDWSSDVCSSDLNSSGAQCPSACLRPVETSIGFACACRAPAPEPAVSPAEWGGRAGSPHYSGRAPASRPSPAGPAARSEEHTSELQSLMRISYAVFCLKKKKKISHTQIIEQYDV